jgi:hypothetical protein
MTITYFDNPFDRHARVEDVYLSLKRDCDNGTSEILNSLPRFVRMAMIEKDKGWSAIINRHDLLVEILVNASDPILLQIAPNLSVCTNLDVGEIDISDEDFLNLHIVLLSNRTYTVKEFIQAIAYNGGFHVLPDHGKDFLRVLYEQFCIPHPAEALQLANAIGKVLMHSYESIHGALSGYPHAFCDVGSRQPMIVDQGVLVTIDGKPAMAFSANRRTYFQTLVPFMERKGIRVGLILGLTNQGQGTIFSLGHRKVGTTNLRLHYNPSRLLLCVQRTGADAQTQNFSVPIDAQMRLDPVQLEVAIYPTGEVVIGINEKLVLLEHLSRSYTIPEGKLMIGADLDGQRCGDFRSQMTRISLIDHRTRIKCLRTYAVFKCDENDGHRLAPNAVVRPLIWRA